MKNRRRIREMIVVGITLLIGCILCGLGTDLEINTILYPGIGFCIFSSVFLIICVFQWIDEA